MSVHVCMCVHKAAHTSLERIIRSRPVKGDLCSIDQVHRIKEPQPNSPLGG